MTTIEVSAEELVAQLVTAYASRHGLSPQERRLLIATINGRTEKEAAFLLGCRRSTTSTYWQRIFHKTARRSQIEVVSDVLRWSLCDRRRRQLADVTHGSQP
jgi:DNA-binding CsgD family transcriptional regulator